MEVVDISAEGARTDQPLNLPIGTRVRLRIANVDVAGKVAWSGDIGTGLEFDAPLAVLPPAAEGALAQAA